MTVYSELSKSKAKMLEAHKGHDIVVNDYPREGEVTVECETCYEILFSFLKEDEEGNEKDTKAVNIPTARWESNLFTVDNIYLFKEAMDMFGLNVKEIAGNLIKIGYSGENLPLWSTEQILDRNQHIEAFEELDYEPMELPEVIGHFLLEGEVAVVKRVAISADEILNTHSFAVNSEGRFVETSLEHIKELAEEL